MGICWGGDVKRSNKILINMAGTWTAASHALGMINKEFLGRNFWDHFECEGLCERKHRNSTLKMWPMFHQHEGFVGGY